MGGGTYDNNTRAAYVAMSSTKTADEIFTKSFTSRKEFKKLSKMTPSDLGIRESRDSEEHPNSIAIIIALDVTGSMGRIPEKIVKNDLTIIMNTLIQAGVEDTQIMFMGIGDHEYDNSPLQVGQFESSDELMASWLEALDIESGGGGNSEESYNLAWLVGGWHTSIDCWEKRKRKGFIFTIGDEGFYDKVDAAAIKDLTGTLGQTWTAQQMLDKAKESFHVYHVHTDDGSYPSEYWAGKRVVKKWKDLIGQNLIITKTYHDIAKAIADTIVSHKDDEWTNPVVEDKPSAVEDKPSAVEDKPSDIDSGTGML